MPEDIYSILETKILKDTTLQKKFCDVVHVCVETKRPYLTEKIGDIFNDNRLARYKELIKWDSPVGDEDPDTGDLLVYSEEGLVLKDYEKLTDLILRSINIKNIPLTDSLVRLAFKLGVDNLLPSSKRVLYDKLFEILLIPYPTEEIHDIQQLIIDGFIKSKKTESSENMSDTDDNNKVEPENYEAGIVLDSDYLKKFVYEVLKNNSAQAYSHHYFDMTIKLLTKYKDAIDSDSIKNAFKIIERDFCPKTRGNCGITEGIKQTDTFFLAHDFDERFFPVNEFQGIIREIIENKTKLKMVVVEDSGDILCKACELIKSSSFGIYDLSTMWQLEKIKNKAICNSSNPGVFCKERARSNVNVAIEYGIAMGFGKRAITLNKPNNLVDGGGIATIKYNSLEELKTILNKKKKEHFRGKS